MFMSGLDGAFPPAPPDRRGGEDLLDLALHALAVEGLTLEDAETLDILRSADALTSPPTDRVRLRPRLLRRVLREIPAAFNLHDRHGAKAFTLAGGMQARGAPARWDGVDFTSLGDPAHAPAHASPSARLAELHRLCLALLRGGPPLYLRGGRPESVDSLRSLLEVLRGSAVGAEEKPCVILQVNADRCGVLDAPLCRMLVTAARRSIPVALATPLPDGPPSAPGDRAGAAALAVAATMVHQLARRQAPLAWTLRLPPQEELTAASWRSWSDLHALAERLELPTLALIPGAPQSAPAAAAATAASASRVRAIVFAEGAGDAAGRRSPALAPALRAALIQVVRNETARSGVEAPDFPSEPGDV